MELVKNRTIEQITNEHNQLCYRVGAASYRLKVEQSQLDQLYMQIQKLNIEASELKSKKEKEDEATKNLSSESSVPVGGSDDPGGLGDANGPVSGESKDSANDVGGASPVV